MLHTVRCALYVVLNAIGHQRVVQQLRRRELLNAIAQVHLLHCAPDAALVPRDRRRYAAQPQHRRSGSTSTAAGVQGGNAGGSLIGASKRHISYWMHVSTPEYALAYARSTLRIY